MTTDRSRSSTNPLLLVLVLLVFLLSGAAALIYEVVWTREITNTFGGTSAALATVLAAFMAGLALGAATLGRWVDRARRPWLLVYAILEIAIGLYGLAVPGLLDGLDGLFRWFYRTFEPTSASLLGIRFVSAFLLFLVPTTLMGGTLPVLAKAVIGARAHLSRRAALLYGSNTFGAALGTFLAGFVLIPRLGLDGARAGAVALNFFVALVSLGLFALERGARREVGSSGGEEKHPESPSPVEIQGNVAVGEGAGRDDSGGIDSGIDSGGIAIGVLALAYAMSGFAALSLEMVWTKVLSLVVGTTTYAFAAMLTAFLLGLAIGSFAVSRVLRSARGSSWLLYWVFVGIAVTSSLSLWTLGRLPFLYLEHFSIAGSTWDGYVNLMFLLSLLVLLPPTTLFGATFGLMTRLVISRFERIGSGLGALYAVNTMGSVLGAVTTGFVAIPRLGRQGAGLVAVGVTLAVAILLGAALFRSARLPRRILAIGGLLAAAFTFALAARPWDPQVIASGPYVYFQQFRQLGAGLREYLRRVSIEHLWEEPEAITTVVSSGDYRYLKINGKTDASDEQDMETQRLLAYAPLAYRPDARRVLVIGLGSGVTAGTALAYPIERLVAVEMLAGVHEAAARFFGRTNGGCLEDPRVEVVKGDGRNHLLLQEETYDVVISQPSNPWIAGIGSLFTREHFELTSRRLAPRGVYCQWIQTYQLRAEDLRDVLGTLRSVFRHVHLWGNMEDLMAVASNDPLEIPAAALLESFRTTGIREPLAALGIGTPAELLAYHLTDTAGIDRLVASGFVPVTDDNLRLEYQLPRNLFENHGPRIASEIQASLAPVLPYLVWDAVEEPTRLALTDELGEVDAADARYYGALAREPWGSDRAIGLLRGIALEVPAHAPARNRYLFWRRALGESLYGQGNLQGAAQVLGEVLERGTAVDAYGAALILGDCAMQRGEPAVAESIWSRAQAIHPEGASAPYNLGLAYEQLGRPDRARAAFARALELNPFDPEIRAKAEAGRRIQAGFR